MTIKVIKRGVRPEDVVYNAECGRCGTQVEFQQSDAVAYYAIDQRDVNSLTITCPVCSCPIIKYI
jgi:ribosomal protein S27AE